MDNIITQLNRIENMVYFLSAFVVIHAGLTTAYIFYNEQGGRFKRIADLSKKVMVKEWKLVVNKVQDLGSAIKPKPDIHPVIEKATAQHYLEHYQKTGELLNLSPEGDWLPVIRPLGGVREDWVRLVERWKVEGIIRQQVEGATGGTGARLIPCNDGRGMIAKMKQKAA